MPYKFVRASDPKKQCEGSTAFGQCPFEKLEGSNYCPRHGGNKAVNAKEKQDSRLYALGKFQAQVGQFVDSTRAKSLAEEIGIVRMLLQTRIEACKDSAELLMSASTIGSLTDKISTLSLAWHRIEKDRALFLDADRAKKLADGIIGVITNYIDDPDILQAISEDIADEFTKLNQ